MVQTKKVRISLGTFDLAKGIALFCVIFGHMQPRFTVEELPFLAPFYLFMRLFGEAQMPMLFIISGFGHKEKTCKKMLGKTFSELVVPYFTVLPIYTILYIMLNLPLFWTKDVFCEEVGVRLAGYVLGLSIEKDLFGYHLWAPGSLWFFWALFVAENLLNLITKAKNEFVQVLLVALCSFAGFALFRYDFTYYSIPQGLLAVGYCYIGYLLKKHKVLERGAYSAWTYIILGIAFIIQIALSIYRDHVFMMVYGNYDFWEFILVGCSGILIMYLSVLGNDLNVKGLGWLRHVGMHSYWIIIIHALETMSIPWNIMKNENPSVLFAFTVEVILKIGIFMMGCEVMKKISQYKYKKKIEKHSKLQSAK